MKKTIILLGIIFFIGIFIRTFHLWDNISFSYDQARDAQRIREIVVNHHLKMVGPETDIPGIFNGPFYYYLLLPVYWLTNFNPNSAVLLLTFINLSGIVLVYYLGKKLSGEKTGLLAAFFWAISYEQANYSKYLSNGSLMSVVTLIFFIGCALFFLKNEKKGLLIGAIGLGLSVQINFYLIYLIGIVFIYWAIYKPKIHIPTTITSLLLLGGLLSSFAVSEILWKFPATKSLLIYLNQQSASKSIMDSFSAYIQSLANSFNNNIFSFNNFIFIILFLFLSIYSYKNYSNKKNLYFLYVWLFSTLPLFAFTSAVVGSPVINSSIIGAIILLFSLSLVTLMNKGGRILVILLLLLTVASNLKLYILDNFNNNKLLSYQEFIYKDKKDAVDYTYQSSNKQPFSVCALTNPLFINTVWSDLYKTYGENKYGYIPFWSGPKQYQNINYLPYDYNHVPLRYLIIEPLYGLRDWTLKNFIYAEDKISTIQEVKKFGGITVQKRELEKDKNKLVDSQQVPTEEAIRIESTLKTDPRYSCFISY